MTLKYICDNCGETATVSRIVGNEFAYLDHHFGSLASPIDGKRDLCKACMRKAEISFRAAQIGEALRPWRAAAEALKAPIAAYEAWARRLVSLAICVAIASVIAVVAFR